LSLQADSYLYKSLHDKLNKDVKEEDKKSLAMARVSNIPCPVNLDKIPPVKHIHQKNGVFIAVEGETIYCTCSVCKFEKDREGKGGSLTLVSGTEGEKYGWAIITEQSYKTLLSSACVTGKQSDILSRVLVSISHVLVSYLILALFGIKKNVYGYVIYK